MLRGIFRYTRNQNLSARIMVYPELVDENELPPLITQQLGELSRHKQLIPDPFLIRGIRDYVPGDPARDIHWPATAKMGKPQWLTSSTARENLPQDTSPLYEEARYSDNPISHEAAAEFAAKTKRL